MDPLAEGCACQRDGLTVIITACLTFATGVTVALIMQIYFGDPQVCTRLSVCLSVCYSKSVWVCLCLFVCLFVCLGGRAVAGSPAPPSQVLQDP